MTNKQKDAKAKANGSIERFIELMGYDLELVSVPTTWKEALARFR
ncbi:hypothetical protein QOZ63_24695 [Pseudomonas aeruginosa]|nr:hypothetical protein [Pseudomonas aeruginosa]